MSSFPIGTLNLFYSYASKQDVVLNIEDPNMRDTAGNDNVHIVAAEIEEVAEQIDIEADGKQLQHSDIQNKPFKSPGSVAQLDARSTDDQEGVSSRLRSGNILSLRLIMKSILRSFSPFRWFKKGSCQLLAKKNVHSELVNRLIGLSLPRKSVDRLTDRPNMT